MMQKDIKQEFIDFLTKDRKICLDKNTDYSNNIENTTRAVIEERNSPFREIDVFSRLIMDRIIFLGTEINENIANIIVAQLLFLASVDSKKSIHLYINSPGGSVHAGLSIYDTMQFIAPEVNTICCGLAASFGAILLAGGAKGKRSALKHARIMIHQPMGGMRGQFSDLEISLKHYAGLRDDLYKILAYHTQKKEKEIEKDSDRDYWMTAIEAKDYGLIDEVLEKK